MVAVEFEERLSALATKIKLQRAAIKTEEATKNAFVMPFISTILGYDVFNPLEVVPEFIADVGMKKAKRLTTPSCEMARFRSSSSASLRLDPFVSKTRHSSIATLQ